MRGIRAQVIERRGKERISLPKMNSVNVRTMEFCRRWGIRDRVSNTGWPKDYPRRNIYMTSLDGFKLAAYDYGADEALDLQPGTISPERFQRCPQTWFDPLLEERALEFESISVRHGVRLDTVVERAGKVLVTATDLGTGSTEQIVSDYLLACDGSRSKVRELLGIEVDGSPRLSMETNVYFSAEDLFRGKTRATMVWFIGPDGMWSVITAVDGVRTWRLWITDVPQDHEMTQAEAESHVRAAIGPDIPFTYQGTLPWMRQQLVARRYRSGRILLCGDAVHNLTPCGGFGMNTGIQDAVDACWKLAGVLEGWAHPDILDTYEQERRPVGVRNVNEATHSFDKILSLPRRPDIADHTPQGEQARREVSDHIHAHRFNREYENLGIVLGYRYAGSPICVPDGPPEALPVPQVDDPVEADEDVMAYRPSARPGALAPHFWLADGRSVKDLFGVGFTLLRLGGSPPEVASMVKAAATRGVPLAIHHIPDEAARVLYGRSLVLVRPDGHVAWRADEPPADAMAIIDTVRGARCNSRGAAK